MVLAALLLVAALRVEPETVRQGGIISVEVELPASEAAPICEWLGRKYPMYPITGGYRTLLPVDRLQKTGQAHLVLHTTADTEPFARASVSIIELDTGPVEIIRLTPDRMALQKDPRLEDESRRIRKVLSTETREQLWTAAFQLPLTSRGRNYGKKRQYVETARRRRGAKAAKRPQSFTGYHRGLDFSADAGVPVMASNAGQVLAAEPFVLPGNAVFVDHGQGLITSYFHLREIRVKPGDIVAPGAVIGTVGSTGRSTGPHLHWSVYVHGQTVNPEEVLKLQIP